MKGHDVNSWLFW